MHYNNIRGSKAYSATYVSWTWLASLPTSLMFVCMYKQMCCCSSHGRVGVSVNRISKPGSRVLTSLHVKGAVVHHQVQLLFREGRGGEGMGGVCTRNRLYIRAFRGIGPREQHGLA